MGRASDLCSKSVRLSCARAATSQPGYNLIRNLTTKHRARDSCHGPGIRVCMSIECRHLILLPAYGPV